MKKLNLEKLKLTAEDVLQRDQLSTIYGGSGNCNNNGYWKCMCSPDGPWQSIFITDCSYPEDAMVECTTVIRCERI
jgi:hypothetical protein